MSHRVLGVLIVIGLVVAGVTFVQFQRTYFWALLSTPMAGAYGMSWTDLPSPEIRAEGRARAHALFVEAVWTQRVSYTCAALSLAAIPVAAWRNRRDVRSWHWLSFLGLGLLIATATLGYLASLNGPRRAGLLAMVGLALAASVIDLRRGKYGAPGWPVAWLTMLLSLLFGFVLLSDA